MGTKYNGALPPRYNNMTMCIDADNPKSFNPGGLYGDDYGVTTSPTATQFDRAEYFIKYTHNPRSLPFPASYNTITGLKDISPDSHNYATFEQYNQGQRVIGPVHGKWYFNHQNSNTLNGYAIPGTTSEPLGMFASHHPNFRSAFLDVAHIRHPQSLDTQNVARRANQFWDSSYEGMDSNGLVNGHAITNYYCVIVVGELSDNEQNNKLWQVIINDNVIRSHNPNFAAATDIVPLTPGMIVDCGTTLGHWEIGPAISTTARDYGAIYSFHPIRPAVYNTQFPHPKWSVDQFLLPQLPIKPTGNGNVFYKTCEQAPSQVFINTTSSAQDKFWWGATTEIDVDNGSYQLKFHPDAEDVPAFDTTKYYYFYVYDEFGSLRIVTRKNPITSNTEWTTIKFHLRPHAALIVNKQYAIVVHEGLETASSNHWPPVKYPDISFGSRGHWPLTHSFMRLGQDNLDDKISFNSHSTGPGIEANYFTLNCWVKMTFDTSGDTQWDNTDDYTSLNENIDLIFKSSTRDTTTIAYSDGVFNLGIDEEGYAKFTVYDNYGTDIPPQSQLTQILSDGTILDGQVQPLPGIKIYANSRAIFKGTSYIGNRNRNWHMVSVTYDAVNDEIKLYVDGEIETHIKRKIGQTGFGFEGLGAQRSSYSSGSSMYLGQWSQNSSLNSSSDSSMVDVNQFQMWANETVDVALSDDEIKQLYEQSRQRFNK